MTISYEQYLEDLEAYHESGGELYGFEGAFKDFNEVLDFVEDRGTQGLSDIANDIGSASGLSAGAAGIAQALGSVLNQSENSSDLTDVINKITNSRKFEVPHGISKVLANNYVVAAALSASALNEYRKDGDADTAAQTIVDSAVSAPIGAAVGASLAYLLAGTISSPFVLGAVAALAASYIGALAIEQLNERGFLDPLYDAAENAIAELFGWLPTPPPHRDPLILDLDGNGVSLTESTYFDHNANGIANRTEWVSSTDGLLVLDRDGNGTIDSGRELFGDNTLVVNGNTASDGYAALEVYDLNSDNVIDKGDEVFDQLKVWVDENSDGVSQEYELKTLSSLGIKSIDLNHENLHSQYSDVQGERHSTQSVILDTSNFDRRFVESLEVPDSFNGLPNMRGTGTVRDLHEAMTLSSQLKDKVEKLSTSSTREEQLDLTGEILFSWAKTSQYYDEHIPVFSGPAIDKVYAIEAFYGEKVPWSVSFGTNGASMALPTEFINSAYDSLIKMIYSELASQTRLKDYYDAITITSDESGLILSLEGALTQFSERTLNPALIADAMDFMSAMSSTSNIDLTGFYTFISNALYGASGSDIEQLQSALEFNGIAISEVEGIKKVTFDDGSITFTEGTSTAEIIGSIRSDQISGTDLDDVIHAGSGNDTVLSGDGNDELHGQDGNDQLFGGEGDDSLTVSYSGSNTLDGGAGDDILTVESPTSSGYRNSYYQTANNAQNTLIGGAGDDRLVGGLGAERYEFNRGDGHDTIRDRDFYGTSVDQIIFGEGIAREELSLRRDGNHMVLVIGGADSGDSITIEEAYVNGEYRIEEIVLADGSSVTPQSLPLHTTDGDDVVQGSAFSEVVDSQAGNDTVNAGSGNDIVRGGEGNDALHGGTGNDQLFGDEGDDSLAVSYSGSNTLDGGAGDDILTVKSPTSSGYRNSYYQTANNAQNTLIGGAGDDRLVGGLGAERYEFNRGDGHDTIRDRDFYGTSVDQIIFGEGIAREELSLRRDGNHMVLVIGGADSGDSITIEEAYVNGEYRIEEIVLADGSSVTPQSLPLHTTDGDDVVQGSAFSEVVDSQAGNDTVNAGSGNDIVRGGEGNDTLLGGTGNDQLFGDEGDDSLTVSYSGSNTLDGGAGDDILTVESPTSSGYRNSYYQTANNAQNTLIGGAGDDRLVGGLGAERYEFNRGDGHDTIRDRDFYGTSVDQIIFGEGIAREELSLRRDGNHMVLVIGGADSGDSITIEEAYVNGEYRIEEIVLADGSSVTPQSLPLHTTDGDDVVQGSAFSEVVDSQAGNDTVNAGSGNDIVRGGEGNDTLLGGTGNDQLFGDEGDDSLTVSYSGSNTLDGGAGDDILTVESPTSSGYRNSYYQTANNAQNTLIGGAGDDRLVGGLGAERYEFNRGDGHDTIRDRDFYGTSVDQIIFGEGIAREELSLRRDGNHMVLVIGGADSGDSITIEEAYVNGEYRIEEIVLADGSSVTPQSLPLHTTDGDDVVQGSAFSEVVDSQAGNDTVNAGSGNDIVRGGEGNDALHGGTGNDQLFGDEGDDSLTVSYSGSNTLDGGAGDDILTVESPTSSGYRNSYYQTANNAQNTLIGGAGDDRLVGGLGAERYEFNRGDGHDTIRDRDFYGTSVDQIIFGEGIAREELSLRRDGNHMVLVIGGADSGDSITIEEAYVNGEYRIEEIVLADGSSVTPQSLPLHTTDGDDVVQGSAFSEVVDSQAGNDTVNAGSGNDIVRGGEGNDTLLGGTGNDQLFGDEGDDSLTVSYSGSNTLDGGAGDDILTVESPTSSGYRNSYYQTANNAQNTLIGGAGDDRLVGGLGAERYEFNRGDGHDTIRDRDFYGTSVDQIIFGEGIAREELSLRRDGNHMVLVIGGADSGDSITIEEAYVNGEYRIEEIVLADGSSVTPQSLPLHTTDGDDVVQGSAFSEVVDSQAGNDTVNAGSGNDIVRGGEGNDALHGGTGNDQLFGDEGDDSLTVSYSGSNTLDGGAGDDILTVESPTSSGYRNSYYQTANNAQNTLIGGAGDDRLVGGLGAERYEFNRGDGHDTIRDRDFYGTSVDQIIFGEGIAREELSLRRDGNHMVLVIGGADSGDSITIEEAYVNGEYRIEEIVLADGSSVTPQSLPLHTTDGDDVVQGSAFSEVVDSQAGNDTVNAGSGNDIVRGGEGNDALHGGTGNDQLFGDEGDDSLTVSYSGSNTLDGGAGDDILTVESPTSSGYRNSYYQTANNAQNTLIGGAGDDRLVGGLGAERYEFNRGDGHDTIRDRDFYGTSVDQIIFGEGIAREELSLRRDGNHMVLVIGGADSGDSITIEEAYVNGEYRIEEIVLADGSSVTPQSLPLHTTDGDDVVQGSAFSEVVDSQAGNDTVNAGSGNDIVRGGEGNDALHGGTGNDQLFGDEGDDSLTVSYSGSNTLDGGAGDDILTVESPTSSGYRNSYYQTANNAQNTLIGGAGDDRLVGGLGAERYEFNRGDGHDTIRDRDFYGTSVDQIIFGEGIAREELSLRRDGNHMVLLIGGPDSGDLITIENAYTDSQYCIEEVVLTDGTTFILLELPEYSEVETGLLVQSMSSFDGFDLSLTTSSALTSVDVLSPPLVASNQN